MGFITKSLVLTLGLTVCGISGYLLYLLYKKEENEYFDPFDRASKFRILEISVPKNMVNILIGRQGKNIKQIQEQSNTRISFKDGSEDEMICVIKGSLEACNVAENLVQEFITNQPVLESLDIWIPQILVGRIIGRSGDRIKEICSSSGAKIIVDKDNNSSNNSTKRLIIKGTKEQIIVAESLINEILEQHQQSKMEIDSCLAKREPRLPPPPPPKSTTDKLCQNNDSPKVERISPIPGQTDSQFEVYVSAMVDPSRFWLQIVGPKATQLDVLVDEMTEYYRKQENRDVHVLDNVNKGDLVAAIFQYDSKWYRAEVLTITSERQAELYFVDYGDTDLVPCHELYELRTDFLTLHFQAIECFLAKIDPIGEDWSEDAIDIFEELSHVAQWKKLSAKINGYCVREKTRAKREGSPIPGVDLFDVNNEQDIDIAQELVNRGLAVYKKDVEVRLSSRTTSVSNISVASSS